MGEPGEALKRAWLLPLIFFGLTSLLADVCYEGFRGILGPVTFEKGGGWLELGLVVVEAELVNWVLRLPLGILADVLRAWWLLTFLGYALTPIGVLVAVAAPGVAGVAVGVAFERLGKTIRAPSRDALLAGLGEKKGIIYAIHEVMDQVGAVAGPLLAYLLLQQGLTWAVSLPGFAALATLAAARLTYPAGVEPRPRARPRLAIAASFTLLGVVSVLTPNPLIVAAALGENAPIAYTLAMLADALAALPLGRLYDRIGSYSLLAAPAASIAAAALFTSHQPLLASILVGVALAAYETVYRAYIADKCSPAERATGFGAYGLGFGIGQAASALLYAAIASRIYG